MTAPAEHDKVEIAKAIAAQIGFEQGLVAARLNWNLTFQGFMIASYALVATAATTAPSRELIQSIIISAGVVVSLATLLGILASRNQSSYLKKFWEKQGVDASGFPRPFADSSGSFLGRIPPILICVTIIAMWLSLLIID